MFLQSATLCCTSGRDTIGFSWAWPEPFALARSPGSLGDPVWGLLKGAGPGGETGGGRLETKEEIDTERKQSREQ